MLETVLFLLFIVYSRHHSVRKLQITEQGSNLKHILGKDIFASRTFESYLKIIQKIFSEISRHPDCVSV